MSYTEAKKKYAAYGVDVEVAMADRMAMLCPRKPREKRTDWMMLCLRNQREKRADRTASRRKMDVIVARADRMAMLCPRKQREKRVR